MDPNLYFEVYRQQEAELELELRRRLDMDSRPQDVVRLRDRFRAWWAPIRRQGAAPARAIP
ncbi:hypothetical protein [Georgenia alba]|uniref:DUF3263 domain-containing protein n=1 Tax=Georgenia alba TaxID=2233858 RepID=A0ABW2QAV3_9MICO